MAVSPEGTCRPEPAFSIRWEGSTSPSRGRPVPVLASSRSAGKRRTKWPLARTGEDRERRAGDQGTAPLAARGCVEDAGGSLPQWTPFRRLEPTWLQGSRGAGHPGLAEVGARGSPMETALPREGLPDLPQRPLCHLPGHHSRDRTRLVLHPCVPQQRSRPQIAGFPAGSEEEPWVGTVDRTGRTGHSAVRSCERVCGTDGHPFGSASPALPEPLTRLGVPSLGGLLSTYRPRTEPEGVRGSSCFPRSGATGPEPCPRGV